MSKVSLPLTPDIMVEFFKDKSVVYEIDMEKSMKSLNERSMLMYLSNLGISCNVDTISDELLFQYMTIKEFCNIPNLAMAHANVLYLAKYGLVAYEELLDEFSIEQMSDFISNHTDLVAEQLMYLDSMLLYFLSRDEDFDQAIIKNKDDQLHDELGFSVLKLFKIPEFMLIYSQDIPDLSDQTYYTRYFDEYMFNGKNLFEYISGSAFFGLVAQLSLGYEDESVRQEMIELYNGLSAALQEQPNDRPSA